MKIMITWQLHPGKFHEILQLFTDMTDEQESNLMGSLKLIGRWHDSVRGTGAAVYEADNAEDVAAYAMNWNDFMDLDLSIVLDDEECKALGRRIAQSKA